MSFPRWAVVLVFLPVFLTPPACPQDNPRDTDSPAASIDSLRRMNSASIVFDKNLNTFNWFGRLMVDTVIERTHIGVATQYLSNIILTEGAARGSHRESESTQQMLRLALAHPLTEPVGIHTEWSSLVYSDNRGIGLSNASNHTLLAGADVLLVIPDVDAARRLPVDRQGTIQDRVWH
jgi:hypothetical protein